MKGLPKLPFLVLILCMLAGCQKVEIYNDKCSLQRKAARQLAVVPHYQSHSLQDIEERLQGGISRNDAIGIALQHNPHIQADLETLGIAKADVKQAGLFTNPSVQTVFYAPLRGPTFANNTQCDINLADFWLVPLRKKVQQKEFEQTSLRILATMLDVTKEASLAYARVLLYKDITALYRHVIDRLEALFNTIEYRTQFGLEDTLDHMEATITLNQARNTYTKSEALLSESYAQLRFTLGVSPTIEPMLLTEDLQSITSNIAPVDTLIMHAQANRPAILEAQLAEQQYQAKLSLEKANIFKEINAGVAFQQDFDRNRGIGASLSFNLPLFDTNHVQVNRTRSLLRQAQLNTKQTALTISKEIYQLHTQLNALHKQITNYTMVIIPAALEGFEFAYQYQQIQQITMPTLLQVHTEWIEHTLSLTHLYHEAYQTMINLERAATKRIAVE